MVLHNWGGKLKKWPKLSSEDFFELPELVGLDHISGLLVHLIHLLWLDSGLLMNKATFVLQIHESLFVFPMRIEVVPEIEIIFLLNSACLLQSYEIKSPPRAILGSETLEIFSVEY